MKLESGKELMALNNQNAANNDSLSFRPATPEDCKGMLVLEAKVIPAPWTKEHFTEELEKPYSQTYVLTDDETDEKIFGYIVFWILGEHAEILNLVVEPKLHRQGWGTRLVDQVKREALKSGLNKILLDVRKSNARAIQFYQKLSFFIHSSRSRFYSNGEDAYHMQLNLNESNEV